VIRSIGWLSTVCLTLCGVPQVIKILRTKNTLGVSMLFAVLWAIGEFLGLIYVIAEAPRWPLVCNYIFSRGLASFLVVLLLVYKEAK